MVESHMRCAGEQAAELVRAGIMPWAATNSRGESCMHLAAAQPAEEALEQHLLWEAFFSVCCSTDAAAATAAAAKELLCKPNAQGLNCMQLAASSGNAALEQQIRSWVEGRKKAICLI